MNTLRRRLTRSLAVLAFATALTAASTQSAHASSSEGYVCRVTMLPKQQGSYGYAGSIHIDVNSGQGCTGSLVDRVIICSSGATNTAVCAPSSQLYATGLSALLQSLQRAASWGQKVKFVKYSGHFAYVSFLAD